MAKITRRSLLLGVGALPVVAQPARAKEKHLLLDSRIIDRADGAELALGQVRKEARNPLLREDKPWEPRYDNLYANVMFDEGERLFKCWYSPFIMCEVTATTPPEKRVFRYTPGKREMGVCYATPKDGVAWRKPELGIIEFNGSTKNNLVARGPHGAGVFKDLRDPDTERRYKMFFRRERGMVVERSMAVSFSADGLRWSGPVACRDIQAAGDSHNNSFWAPELNKYVGITRLKTGGERFVGRTESADFLKWTKAVEVFRSLPEEGAERQTYAMPVFRYANVYLGLVTMFDTRSDAVDCELAWSPDTVKWERICPGTPLIPRGPEGSYDSGCIYAAAYPVMYGNELRLYYGGSDATHFAWRKGFCCLARLRPDGFAGVQPARSGAAATIVTKPVRCSGQELRVSADAAAGSLRVAVLEADGLDLERSRPIKADVTDRAVGWEGGRGLAALEGREVRLRFELQSARLYSFSFS